MRALSGRSTLALTLIAAAAGYLIGAASAPAATLPEPTIPVAAVPTSTPDLRPPPPTATPIPTAEPPHVAITAAPSSAPVAVDPGPPVPERIVLLSPTPVPAATRSPGGGHVVYVARIGQPPLAVPVEGAGLGATPAERVLSRLTALTKAAAPQGSVNLAARSGAFLVGVSIEADQTVTLEYVLQGGTWGYSSQQDLWLLMQQIVFTATEEPGVDTVILRRFGSGVVPVRPEEAWTFKIPLTRDEVLALK